MLSKVTRAMPPQDRPLPINIAQPRRSRCPTGRWAEALTAQLRAAIAAIETDETIGELGEIACSPTAPTRTD